MKKRLKLTLRFKLTASMLSIVLIVGVATIIIGLRLINNNIVLQAYHQVENDLKTAQYIYNGKINTIHLFTKHLSSLPYVKEAILANNRQVLLGKMKEVKEELELDILNITDMNGRIIVRAGNQKTTGDSVADDLFIKYVMTEKKPCQGTDIIEEKHLILEGKELAEQAFIRIKPTPRARSIDRKEETRGLLLKAAAPVLLGNRLIGIIYGARLLNRNYEIVDRIKNLVFQNEKVEGTDYGTATIFLDDLRISTNVQENGIRAIGTRVSEEVYNRIFNEGRLWIDKAFVVNNWYISAYSPIYNLRNEAIGILYVGILESRFNKIKRETTIFYLIIITVSLQIAILLSIYLIRNILIPIKALVNASNEIVKGNYSIKIPEKTTDELGYLCRTFNTMVNAIVERDNMLKEDTQKQIFHSEKLASLGKLAAGIAHEINNPLTGVLTYSSILLEELRNTKYSDDLQTVVDETLRCRKIVREILNFARETRIEKEPAELNKVISDTLSILEKHMSFQNINIIKNFDPHIPVMGLDVNQIKSVVNNLALNAADAMHEGGVLTISTGYDNPTETVTIEISDTGVGIPEENMDKIFDPFYTTKQTGKGTGLGLAVTYGIVKRHNGTISVKSTVNEGTTFTIKLPVIHCIE